MSILRMDPEEARDVSWKLNQISNKLHTDLPGLQTAASKLETAEPDVELVTLLNDLRTTFDKLIEVANVGDELSLRLNKEVAKWETIDEDGATEFSGVCATIGPMEQSDLIAVAPSVSVARSTVTAPEQPPPPTQPQPESQPTASEAEAIAQPEADVADQLLAGQHAATAQAVLGKQAADQSPTNGWKQRLNDLDSMNGEIKALESRSVTSLSAEEANRLNQLHSERNDLRQLVNEGISETGPGPMHRLFPEGECTWYASSRRDFGYDLKGDAREWADRALEAGYDVGDVPVKGSVMVWQPGAHSAHEVYGHVSYVERVVPERDGSFTVFYTDNDNPDSSVRVTINPGEEGVDFIYDKLLS
ncbi:MAG: CHAP domain-containing protein [Chloroflexi bacterium]|nr:CHAP domain-containing protein [Chloroflexota bacterium]